MKIIKCCLLLFCLPFFLLAQSNYDIHKKFDPQALQEDLSVMRKHLETMHGGLYTYTTKAEMDKAFDQLMRQLNQPMTELEFYKKVGRFNALIKDAHTSIDLSQKGLPHVEEEMKMLPLGLRYIDDKLYISRNLSQNDAFQRGEVLEAIDGKNALEIFNELLPYIERDGNNLTSPKRSLANLFMDKYVMIYGEKVSFEVEVRTLEGSKEKRMIKAEKWPDQEKKWVERYGPWPKANPQQLDFSIEGNMAIMKVRSWHPGRIKAGKQKYKKFFQSAFESMAEQGIENLVLDMRNNGGGSEIVFMEFFGHLVNEPYTVYKELSTKTIKIPDHQYYPYDKVKRLETYGKLKMKKLGDRYIPKNDPSMKPAKPLTPYYDGKLYVLINERSHSASGDLSGLLRSYDRATFIGQESGGNPFENTAGESPTLYLPNTGIRVTIPILKYVINRPDKNTGHGIIPEHKITPSFQDILERRDPVMEFTRKLIKTKQ